MLFKKRDVQYNKLLWFYRVATQEADEKSDDIVNEFLSGQMADDEFVKRFQAQREEYNTRAAKVERCVLTHANAH